MTSHNQPPKQPSPPFSFPLDHVPIVPTGRVYRIKRWFRRAFETAMLAAASIFRGLV